MPEDATLHLRIYCVCGQKMKVTDKLFGRPGKCIACRQKIRIPRRDEIPEGTTEIYLKDHPEFLRKSSRKRSESASKEEIPMARREKIRPPADPENTEKAAIKRSTEEPAAPEAIAEPDRAAPAETVDPPQPKPEERKARKRKKPERTISVALDVLEPVRELCSLREKIESNIAAMEEGASDDATAISEAEGHLARIRGVRADVNEQLRQSLMETAIELASTQEKISEALLAARVGESDLVSYQASIYKLRERRDRLERRQQNLRGWLAAEDPHTAGGYVDLPITSLPEAGAPIAIPSESEDSGPLVNRHSAALREAFGRRSDAERKLAELDRLQEQGASGGDELARARANADGDLKRYDARIAFCRERLQQASADYANDLETFKAQLELGRGRLQVDEIRRAEFDALEKKLRRARTDAMKAKSLAERTLAANSAHDVPPPRGSFLDRIKARPTDAANRVELWMGWGAAAALILATFLPSVGNSSLVGAFIEFRGIEDTPTWAFVLPLMTGVAIIFVMRILGRALRASLLAALWLVGTLAGVYLVHETAYGMDPMSARFRTGAVWLSRPGMILLILGNIGMLSAAILTYVPIPKQRPALYGAIAAAAIAALGILTDLGGYFRAAPVVSVDAETVDGARVNADHQVTITVGNNGGRTLYLVTHRSLAKDAYRFFLQRKIGVSSWADAVADNLLNAPGQNYSGIAPGASTGVRVSLSEGEYRALLVYDAGNDEIAATFRIGAGTTPQADSAPDSADTIGENAPKPPAASTDAISGERTTLSELGGQSAR